MTLTPPIGWPSPGAEVRGGHPLEHGLLLGCGLRVGALVDRRAELSREVLVLLAGIAPRARGHLHGEEAHDQAILVGGPGRAVPAEERGAGALLATESERAVQETLDEVLESHRHLDEAEPEARGDAVDEAAAHDRLSHPGRRRPRRAVAEQV